MPTCGFVTSTGEPCKINVGVSGKCWNHDATLCDGVTVNGADCTNSVIKGYSYCHRHMICTECNVSKHITRKDILSAGNKAVCSSCLPKYIRTRTRAGVRKAKNMSRKNMIRRADAIVHDMVRNERLELGTNMTDSCPTTSSVYSDYSSYSESTVVNEDLEYNTTSSTTNNVTEDNVFNLELMESERENGITNMMKISTKILIVKHHRNHVFAKEAIARLSDPNCTRKTTCDIGKIFNIDYSPVFQSE
jgi:hypothetical protein